jgi:hypothetical protein
VEEIDFMGKVYAGILQKSINNMQQIQLVVNGSRCGGRKFYGFKSLRFI